MLEHNEFHLAIINELQELQHLQRKLTKSLESAPAGSLHVLQKQGKPLQYYSYEGRNRRKYLSKQKIELARSLAQKEYDQKLLSRVEEKIQCVRNAEKAYQLPLAAVYQAMAKNKKSLVMPYELSDEDYVRKWYDDHPGSMNAYPVAKAFYSNRGVQVRSKSEKILADMFEKYEIPYIYEPCIHLKTGSLVYPDFLLLNLRKRKQFIYEHFGIMSDAQYADRTIEKISLYQRNDYLVGVNFLFSMESQNEPLDTRNIEKMIEAFLL